MDSQREVISLLKKEFLHSRSRNPAYSLRAFAKRLDLAPSSVSDLLNGNRSISKRSVKKIFDKLCVDPHVQQRILKRFEARSGQLANAHALDMETFSVITEWHYYALLSLMKLKSFKNDPVWIGKRLGLSERKIREAINVLLKLQLIELGPSGKLIRTNKNVTTQDDIQSLAQRKFHKQGLELAEKSLERDLISVRDFTSMTLPIKVKDLAVAKVYIRKFYENLSELIETEDGDSVYRLCVQLFPLSEMERSK